MDKIYCKITTRFLSSFILLSIIFSLSFTQQAQLQVKRPSSETEKFSLELKELKNQVDNIKSETDGINSSIVELNRKIERVNNDVINIMTKIEELTREISKLKISMIELEEKVEILSKTSTTTIHTEKYSFEVIEPIGDNIERQINSLRKEIKKLEKELQEIKELQKTEQVSEIKDPNLRRVITSPYLVITSIIISIFALIMAF